MADYNKYSKQVAKVNFRDEVRKVHPYACIMSLDGKGDKIQAYDEYGKNPISGVFSESRFAWQDAYKKLGIKLTYKK